MANCELTEFQYQMHILAVNRSKLKSSIRTSTLLAGFSIVSLIEIDFHQSTPTPLLIAYAVHSTVLVLIHLLSLMLATCLLPELEAISVLPVSVLAQNGSLNIAKLFTIQLCWVLSNIIGIIIFTSEVCLVAFVKFYSPTQMDNIHAGTATVIIVLILAVLAVPLIVYQSRTISKNKMKLHQGQLEQARDMLEAMHQDMEAAIMGPVGEREEARNTSPVSRHETLNEITV